MSKQREPNSVPAEHVITTGLQSTDVQTNTGEDVPRAVELVGQTAVPLRGALNVNAGHAQTRDEHGYRSEYENGAAETAHASEYDETVSVEHEDREHGEEEDDSDRFCCKERLFYLNFQIKTNKF
jgi:hypothetical protein